MFIFFTKAVHRYGFVSSEAE